MSMHSGARSNVRASNMAKMVNNGSTFSNFKLGDMHNVYHAFATSSSLAPSNYSAAGGVNMLRSDVTDGRRQGPYSPSFGTTSQTQQTTDPVPILFVSTQSRYSVSTNNAQSLQSIALQGPALATSGRPSSYSNIKFGELVGLSYNAITTDTVGNLQGADGTRDGFGQALTSNLYTTRSNSCTGGYGETRFFKQSGGKNLGVTAADYGWTVTTTFHNNQWEEIYLNTIAGPGDMVVVVAQSFGGTMYTFSTTDPIYLRTASGGSVTGTTVSTKYGPTKNSTGNDTWVAVYTAVVGAGQYVGKVGVNPYHSATQYYIFHTFVIRKGAQTNPSLNVQRRIKYTAQSTGLKQSTSLGFLDFAHGGNNQSIFITLATTPHAFGNFDPGSATALSPASDSGTYPTGVGDNYDLAFEGYGSSSSILPGTSNANYMGRWNVTMCNYTGMQESTTQVKGGASFRMFDGVPNHRYYPGTPNTDPTAYGLVYGPQTGQFKGLSYDFDVILIAITR